MLTGMNRVTTRRDEGERVSSKPENERFRRQTAKSYASQRIGAQDNSKLPTIVVALRTSSQIIIYVVLGLLRIDQIG